VERGWQERTAGEGSWLAGIRTFGLISLLGGLWELLDRGLGEILLGIAFLALVVLLAVAHVAEAHASRDYPWRAWELVKSRSIRLLSC